MTSGAAQKIQEAIEHQKADRFDQARQLYESVLLDDPCNSTALHAMSVMACKSGCQDEAAALVEKAIAFDSQVPQFHNTYGIILNALERFEAAIAAFRQALELKPGYTNARYNMGNSLVRLERYEAAVAEYRRVLAAEPDDAFNHYNLGVALQKLGRHQEAIEELSTVAELGHDPGAAYKAIAASNHALGRYDQTIDFYRKALGFKPDCPEIHSNLGMALLQSGNFQEGWNEYSWRLRSVSWMPSYRDVPQWDGSDFKGKRLLVRSEQGLGDSIQFVRYLPIVKARGGQVILATYQPLVDLMRTVAGCDVVACENESIVFDIYCPMMELPRILGTTPATIPAEVPYLYANPTKEAQWRSRLNTDCLKVGIVWGSGPLDRTGPRRSCRLRDFVCLASTPGVCLYGLQKGEAVKEIAGLPDGIVIDNLGDDFEDFGDTAAAIENMDLVISVDTSVLHLAGAMGKPVWALTLFSPDWRWMSESERCPWYPTMKLFRQKAIGQWDDVFRSVKARLTDLVNRRKTEPTVLIRDTEVDNRSEEAGHEADVSPHDRLVGRMDSAETSDIDHLVASMSEYAGKLHSKGLKAYLEGRYDQAVDLIEKAISTQSNVAVFHNSLGLALEAIGKPHEALSVYHRAVRLRSDFAEAYNNMAIILNSIGRHAEAVEKCSHAIECKPAFAPAHLTMGYAQHMLGQYEQAAASYHHAIRLKADSPEAHNHLGVVLAALGEYDQAISSYKKAIDIDPKYAEAHNNLGVVLREKGRSAEAIDCYQNAKALDSEFAEAYYNLANSLRDEGDNEGAIENYGQAIRIKPGYVDAYYNLGNTLQNQGSLCRAIESYCSAIRLSPYHAEAHWNLALTLLLDGRFSEGWQEYGWRHKVDLGTGTYPHRYDVPLWDGSEFQGKRLLVHYEQGFGDTIQFVRYLPMVKARGGAVVLEMMGSLATLCHRSLDMDELVLGSPAHRPHLDFDLHVSVMDLPAIFGTTIETIPASVPYLRPDPCRVEYWHGRLSSEQFRVGLVWGGSVTHANDKHRSCDLSQFKSLCSVSGIKLYGLQKGRQAAQADLIGEEMGLVNLGDELDDFDDTAAVIENLHLVISVDTSVAHLAGAMGKPVWTLLPFSPDWRWMLGRNDSPWYPTMRLFRQGRPDCWEPVMLRVAQELRDLSDASNGKGP